MAQPSPRFSLALRPVLRLAATLVLGLAGCRDRAANEPPPDLAPLPAPITLDELRGAEYPADLLDRAMVRLSAGGFTPPATSRDAMASMELHPIVALAARGQPVARAAAITMESGGGTGMFYWLHLLERSAGPPSVVASAFLGDRVEVVSLGFAGDTIVVRLVTQGPTDAFCCPTLEVVQRFVPAGSTLVEVDGKP